MTDDERTALRSEIEDLTIKQARVRAETAEETLRILADLGIVTRAAPRLAPSVATGAAPPAPMSAAATGMCPCCGRALDGAARSFAECPLGVECPAMAHKQTNKQTLVHSLSGPGTAVLPAVDRATLLAQPAFDASGEPT